MTSPHLRSTQSLLLSRRIWRRRLVFWGGAFAVGVVSIAFAVAATWAQDLFKRMLFTPWMALLITPLGFMLSAWACKTVFKGAQGSGIPQAIAARQFRDPDKRSELLSLRLTLGKLVLTVFGLMCGASIGREGPTVQVGASIMLQSARWGGMGRERGLILAGSAAGIAAAFNTPLAGIVFAIEEMSRSFEVRTSGVVLSAVIIAGLASLGILGNYSYFGQTAAMLFGLKDWLAVILCGVIGGAAGSLFSWLLVTGMVRAQQWIAPLPLNRTLAFAALCGLAVALAGIASGGMTFGTGYEVARMAVEGGTLPWHYALLKFIATLASSASGIAGGLFAPSLAVGAGIGDLIAWLLNTPSVGAIVVLGMAGYFAGVVKAPITAFVIIVEMTANHGMVIPLMLASFLGYGTSRFFHREALYHTLAGRFLADLKRSHQTAPPLEGNKV